MVFLFFCKLFINNIIILLSKKKTILNKSYYFINLSIIINILPLIPSGNIFNNWISLMIFFPLGFFLLMKKIIMKINYINKKYI